MHIVGLNDVAGSYKISVLDASFGEEDSSDLNFPVSRRRRLATGRRSHFTLTQCACLGALVWVRLFDRKAKVKRNYHKENQLKSTSV
ncbi:MAG: hypothetical protein WA783_05600 [Phormidesmis sp.]